MKNASIHRFREHVAIALPGAGQTVYVTAKEARAIASAMNACARDINARKFVDSEFSTVTVEIKKAV